MRAQPNQVLSNAAATSVPVVSNMLAGKLARFVQLYQEYWQLVIEVVSNSGKSVNP